MQMEFLDVMKEHGVWIATIIAAIIAGIFGLIRKSGNKNSQKIKKIKDSTIYQANGSITVSETKEKKDNYADTEFDSKR